MEAAVTLSIWHVAVLLAVLGVLLNFALIVLIWGRQDTKRTQVSNIDTRVTVLEQRISGIGEVSVRVEAVAKDVSHMSGDLSALTEKTNATWEMVQSIQEFLRGIRP